MGIFDTVASAQPVNTYLPKLDFGRHKVILKQFSVKPTTKMGQVLEAVFLVEESTGARVNQSPAGGARTTVEIPPAEAGESLCYSFFPESAGWGKAYEAQRIKDFFAAVAAATGQEDKTVPEIGDYLSDEAQPARGLRMEIHIGPNAKKCDDSGMPFKEPSFRAAMQTDEEIAEVRAALDESDPLPAAAPKASAQRPTGPAPTTAKAAGVLKGLPKRG